MRVPGEPTGTSADRCHLSRFAYSKKKISTGYFLRFSDFIGKCPISYGNPTIYSFQLNYWVIMPMDNGALER